MTTSSPKVTKNNTLSPPPRKKTNILYSTRRIHQHRLYQQSAYNGTFSKSQIKQKFYVVIFAAYTGIGAAYTGICDKKN